MAARERRKIKPDPPPGVPEWMVTFCDIMSLLTTFFILLLTFSTIETEDFTLAAGSLRGAFGVISDSKDSESITERIQPRAGRNVTEGQDTPPPEWMPMDWKKQVRDIRDVLVRLELEDQLDFNVLRKGFVIHIGSDVLFESGSAELSPDRLPILARLAAVVAHLSNELELAGHTDDTFQPGPKFDTEWGLSIARAASVARYLVQSRGVPPSRVGVAGYGRHRPRDPRETPAARARNRRVDLTILRPVGKKEI